MMKLTLLALLLLSSIGLYQRADHQPSTVAALTTASNGTYVVNNAEVFTENGFTNISADSAAITAVGCRGTCIGKGTVTVNKTGSAFQVVKFVPYNSSTDNLLKVVETRATPFGPRARVKTESFFIPISPQGDGNQVGMKEMLKERKFFIPISPQGDGNVLSKANLHK